MKNLGKEATDKITGFKGIITAKISYITGCDQYGITPPAKDGKTFSTEYFDTGRVEIIGEGVEIEQVKSEKNGGFNRDCPAS